MAARRIWWHDGAMQKASTGFSTAYGRTRKLATAAGQALALRLIADRLERGEAVPGPMNVSFIAA